MERKTFRVEARIGDRWDILVAGVSWAYAYRIYASASLRRTAGQFTWDRVLIVEEG